MYKDSSSSKPCIEVVSIDLDWHAINGASINFAETFRVDADTDGRIEDEKGGESMLQKKNSVDRVLGEESGEESKVNARCWDFLPNQARIFDDIRKVDLLSLSRKAISVT